MRNLVIAILLVFTSLNAFAQSVMIVSHEQIEWNQTGGMGDATTGLAIGLKKNGKDVKVLMPYFTHMKGTPQNLKHIKNLSVGIDYYYGTALKKADLEILETSTPDITTQFIKHENHSGKNYFDNTKGYGPEEIIGESIGVFAKAAAEHILAVQPDVVILNDWTAGLVAFHLRQAEKEGKKIPKIVFAIHNLAYQGKFPVSLYDFLGLPREHFNPEGMEFWGEFGMLKAGLIYSDLVYTVSPQYSEEILTEKHGAGLQGVLRKIFRDNRLLGVLNGIVNEEWSPTKKAKGLEHTFTKDDLSGKARGKAELQKEFGLPVSESTPLFVLTSRLAEQKGIAYLFDALESSVQSGDIQVIIMGQGGDTEKARLKEIEARYPNKFRYVITFDEKGKESFDKPLEKRLIRYGDFFVNASWFEPCGLNQLYALLNGTVPLVSNVGGLINSVKEGITGFFIKVVEGKNGENYDIAATRDNIVKVIQKAAEFYKDKEKLRQMQVAGMLENNSWTDRVQKEIIPMLKYVLTESSKKMTFKRFKEQRKESGAPMCSRVFSPGM
jgi:starch synthase